MGTVLLFCVTNQQMSSTKTCLSIYHSRTYFIDVRLLVYFIA